MKPRYSTLCTILLFTCISLCRGQVFSGISDLPYGGRSHISCWLSLNPDTSFSLIYFDADTSLFMEYSGHWKRQGDSLVHLEGYKAYSFAVCEPTPGYGYSIQVVTDSFEHYNIWQGDKVSSVNSIGTYTIDTIVNKEKVFFRDTLIRQVYKDGYITIRSLRCDANNFVRLVMPVHKRSNRYRGLYYRFDPHHEIPIFNTNLCYRNSAPFAVDLRNDHAFIRLNAVVVGDKLKIMSRDKEIEPFHVTQLVQ